jgi:hypothetical protein
LSCVLAAAAESEEVLDSRDFEVDFSLARKLEAETSSVKNFFNLVKSIFDHQDSVNLR